MTKADRRLLLIARWHALVGVPIPEFIPISRAEITVTAQEVYRRSRTDDSILDEDSAAIPDAETYLGSEHESGVLLSRHERQILAREVRERRVARFREQVMTGPLLLMA